jgi:hypothetical protein
MAQGERPAFSVSAKGDRKDKDGNVNLVPVGAAWPNKKGTGYNVKLDSVPIAFDGWLYLSPPKDDGDTR